MICYIMFIQEDNKYCIIYQGEYEIRVYMGLVEKQKYIAPFTSSQKNRKASVNANGAVVQYRWVQAVSLFYSRQLNISPFPSNVTILIHQQLICDCKLTEKTISIKSKAKKFDESMSLLCCAMIRGISVQCRYSTRASEICLSHLKMQQAIDIKSRRNHRMITGLSELQLLGIHCVIGFHRE